MTALPPRPDEGPLVQTVRLHRDPLGTLRDGRARFGEVFTMRLTTARPVVVVAAADAVRPLLRADPETAHAGAARRRILPLASPASAFGGDGAQHRAARGRVAAAFTQGAVAARQDAIAAIAAEHVSRWPRGRPFRLLPRMRALIDEAFVRTVLGVGDPARARAIARGDQADALDTRKSAGVGARRRRWAARRRGDRGVQAAYRAARAAARRGGGRAPRRRERRRHQHGVRRGGRRRARRAAARRPLARRRRRPGADRRGDRRRAAAAADGGPGAARGGAHLAARAPRAHTRPGRAVPGGGRRRPVPRRRRQGDAPPAPAGAGGPAAAAPAA